MCDICSTRSVALNFGNLWQQRQVQPDAERAHGRGEQASRRGRAPQERAGSRVFKGNYSQKLP